MITLSTRGLAQQALSVLKHVQILPRRLVLSTGGIPAEVPRLRGVWGRALHDLDRNAYDEVFHRDNSGVPRYILRPVQPFPQRFPSFDFILLADGVRYDQSALRAWDIASGMGLGETRTPFVIRRRPTIDPLGRELSGNTAWPLSKAVWPLSGDPEATPCRIQFATPVALNRNGRLIDQPTLKDIVAKGCRRLGGLLPESVLAQWEAVKGELIEWSETANAEYAYGAPVGLARYSGSQRQDFAVPCVPAAADLPEGPGPLWPLLAAFQWIHVGKSTNVGLGQIQIDRVTEHRAVCVR